MQNCIHFPTREEILGPDFRLSSPSQAQSRGHGLSTWARGSAPLPALLVTSNPKPLFPRWCRRPGRTRPHRWAGGWEVSQSRPRPFRLEAQSLAGSGHSGKAAPSLIPASDRAHHLTTREPSRDPGSAPRSEGGWSHSGTHSTKGRKSKNVEEGPRQPK